MPSRKARRRSCKSWWRLRELTPGQRRGVAVWHLRRWRAEAAWRARDLGAPAVWALAAEVGPEAEASDLARVSGEGPLGPRKSRPGGSGAIAI